MNTSMTSMMILSVATTFVAAAEPAQATKAAFPATPAGRTAQAFIKAFNTGGENKMREYSKSHRSKSALEARSMEERLEQYRQFYNDWGKLDIRGVESHDEHHVTVTVKPERGYSGLSLIFQCDDEAPNKLDEIRIMPTFIADVSDGSSNEDAKGGTMGDVTKLTESLKPLRDHFNANKHKHRLIAILSPT